MVAAGAATNGWSATSGGYIVVRRANTPDDSTQSIDWQGDGATAIGTAENTGGAWWNTLMAPPTGSDDDLAARTGLTVRLLN